MLAKDIWGFCAAFAFSILRFQLAMRDYNIPVGNPSSRTHVETVSVAKSGISGRNFQN